MIVSSRSEPVETMRGGHAGHLFQPRDVAARAGRQIGEAPHALGRLGPACDRLVDRLARRELTEIARELLHGRAVARYDVQILISSSPSSTSSFVSASASMPLTRTA